jgi:Sulfotransferase domain
VRSDQEGAIFWPGWTNFRILVTGCQRSGTTMLSRIITQCEGMVSYRFGRNDELDAALILSGFVPHTPQGRYCFQTTYLNESVSEYYDYVNGHKIIWVLRNPFSVIHSMLHNWRNFALNELFEVCGVHLLNEKEKRFYKWFGVWGISRLKRACLSYNGKISQVFELTKRLKQDTIITIEYDSLVSKKNDILPLIYRFIGLRYESKYAEMIHSKSLTKSNLLSTREHALIERMCIPIYREAKRLVNYF